MINQDYHACIRSYSNVQNVTGKLEIIINDDEIDGGGAVAVTTSKCCRPLSSIYLTYHEHIGLKLGRFFLAAVLEICLCRFNGMRYSQTT